MRLLVTMNTGGNWIPANVEASHRAAAERWRREYCQITDSRDIFGDKHRALSQIGDAVESVVWVDGDAIIRHDCPDIADMGTGGFVGVRGVQPWDAGNDPDSASVRMTWQHMMWLTDKLGFLLNERTAKEFVDTSINGGVFAFVPSKHRVLFEWIGRILPAKSVTPMEEQTLINLGIRALRLNATTLPWEFNRVGPLAWEAGPMRWYVQHLAACGMGVDKREALRKIDWKNSATEQG